MHRAATLDDAGETCVVCHHTIRTLRIPGGKGNVAGRIVTCRCPVTDGPRVADD